MNAKTALSALAVVLLLAACGNKGPLVMPQKPVPVDVPMAEPAAPAVDDSAPPIDAPPAVEPQAADPGDPATVPDDGNE